MADSEEQPPQTGSEQGSEQPVGEASSSPAAAVSESAAEGAEAAAATAPDATGSPVAEDEAKDDQPTEASPTPQAEQTPSASVSKSPVAESCAYESLKRELVDQINSERQDAGLHPLTFDVRASVIADKHCKQMVEHGFASHYGLDGLKPYQRYSFAGVNNHVSENISGFDAKEGKKFSTDNNAVSQQLLDAHSQFMVQQPPHDAHKRNVLDPFHTHVGIGCFMDATCFRYVEVYVDRYVQIVKGHSEVQEEHNEFELTKDEAHIVVKSLSPEHDVYACTVYYEPFPTDLTPEEASAKDGYEDFTEDRVAVVWPWDMQRLSDNSLRIPIYLTTLRPGHYYTQVLVRDNVDQISYAAPTEDVDLTAPDVIAATGIVMTCSASAAAAAGHGDVLQTVEGLVELGIQGDNAEYADLVHEVVEPFSEVAVVSSMQDAPLGFRKQIALRRAAIERADDSTADDAAELLTVQAGTGGSVCVCTANAPGMAPVVEARLVAVDEDGELEIPDGFEALEGNLTEFVRESLVGQSIAEIVAEIRRLEDEQQEAAKAAAEAAGGSDQASQAQSTDDGESGQAAESADSQEDSTSPSAAQASSQSDKAPQAARTTDAGAGPSEPAVWPQQVVLCIRRATDDDPAAVQREQLLDLAGYKSQSIRLQIGSTALPRDRWNNASLVVAWTRDSEHVKHAVDASQKAADSAQAPRQEDTQQQQDDDDELSDDGDVFDSAPREDPLAAAFKRRQGREKLMALLAEAGEEREALLAENKDLQHKLAYFFSTRQTEQEKTDKVPGAGAQDGQMDVEKRYYEQLAAVVSERQRLLGMQNRFDATAMEMQGRLDAKESTASQIQSTFVKFKREIAKASVNSRTGKPMPAHIVSQFETTEAAKDHEVEKVRLKNIHLQMQLRKVETKLKDKEQLADGLHLIDFEQLKIENQTLNEKIEDRNEELHKLRKKTTATVQVLTHIKEKLKFVRREVKELRDDVEAVEAQVAAERDQLSKAKHMRDSIRGANAQSKKQQGFVSNDMLVKDFEVRKRQMREMRDELTELREQYTYLKQRSGMKMTATGRGGGGGATMTSTMGAK